MGGKKNVKKQSGGFIAGFATSWWLISRAPYPPATSSILPGTRGRHLIKFIIKWQPLLVGVCEMAIHVFNKMSIPNVIISRFFSMLSPQKKGPVKSRYLTIDKRPTRTMACHANFSEYTFYKTSSVCLIGEIRCQNHLSGNVFLSVCR